MTDDEIRIEHLKQKVEELERKLKQERLAKESLFAENNVLRMDLHRASVEPKRDPIPDSCTVGGHMNQPKVGSDRDKP